MTATYLYCIVRSTRKPPTVRVPAGLPGAERPSVQALDGAMWLVTAAVPLDQYGSGPLEASLRDLDWVSRIAVAHEAVVEHFASARGAAVIPMKLFTMFASPERALRDMRARRRDLEEVFTRIAGCEEWGVKVTRNQRQAAKRSAAKPQTGSAFLAARKQARDEARAGLVAAAEAADAAFESLSEIARERRRRTDGAPGVSPPLLEAAFLVPARQRARFHAAAERLARQVARRGGRLTLSGPWPPYNFINAAAEGA